MKRSNSANRLIIHSDASIFTIGECRWLTGAGLYTPEGYSKSIQLGEGTTNTAEASGIILACWYGFLQGRDTHVRSDSQFCCNVLNGRYSSAKFINYFRTFVLLREAFKRMGLNLTVKWVPREENKEADKLARQATALYKKSYNK